MKVCFHDLVTGSPIERIDSGKRLIIDASHRIKVRAGVEWLAFELLGCHEKDRTEYRLHRFQIFLRLGLSQGGEAEIHDFYLEFPGWEPSEHQIRGLEIAMDHVQLLRGDECFLSLQCELAEVRPSERCVLDEFIERFAANQFHDNVGAVFI